METFLNNRHTVQHGAVRRRTEFQTLARVRSVYHIHIVASENTFWLLSIFIDQLAIIG